MTLAEAHAVLRAALPKDRDISIEVASRDYTHNPGRYVEVGVWDGEEWHRGKTLEAAVRACVDCHLFPQLDPLAEAEAVLADVQVVESAA